jgi:serine/threonine-protein kinase
VPVPAPVAKQKSRFWMMLFGVLAAILVGIGLFWAWNYLSNNLPLQDVQRTSTAEQHAFQLTLTVLSMVNVTQEPVETQPVIIPIVTQVLTNTPTETVFIPTMTFTPISATPMPTLGIGSQMTWEVDGMILVYVPAGPFLIGSKKGEEGAVFNEQPQRTVTLDAFWIDQTEVTNAMYALCVTAGACQPPLKMGSSTRVTYYNDAEFRNFPAIFVSWEDANTYCQWAGRRLPTEAEWEKAARGTDGWIYPWGNQLPVCDLTNYNYCVGDTSRVGNYLNGASPYGALDMAGNVYEWVADWYSRDFYQKGPSDNPHGPASGERRVTRGGSWTYGWERVRTAYRDYPLPTAKEHYIGFRCVASP